jgi:hypothetical protein
VTAASILSDFAQPDPGCCKHDILAESCFWCTPRPGVVDLYDDDTGTVGAHGPARRTGWAQATSFGPCGGCSADIQPGDAFRWTPNGCGRLCEDCADA